MPGNRSQLRYSSITRREERYRLSEISTPQNESSFLSLCSPTRSVFRFATLGHLRTCPGEQFRHVAKMARPALLDYISTPPKLLVGLCQGLRISFFAHPCLLAEDRGTIKLPQVEVDQLWCPAFCHGRVPQHLVQLFESTYLVIFGVLRSKKR